MKILIDTNILFSAVLNVDSKVAKALFYANEHHEIYLSDRNILEIREIVGRKIPRMLPAIEKLLDRLDYEMISATDETAVSIRDAKDQPILNAAIQAGLDIILTGDKDFLCLEIERPRCMNVVEFCELEHIEDY